MKTACSKSIAAINQIAAITLLILSVVNIWAPFYTFSHGESARFLHYLAIHHTIRRLISFVIFIVSWKLYKRVSAAWAVVMLALSAGIFQYILLYHNRLQNPLFLLELASYFVLLLSRNYYCRRPDRYSLRKGLAVFLLYTAFVLVNAVLSLLKAKGHSTFWDGVWQTIDILFDTDNFNLAATGRGLLYHRFLFWFSWGCILIALLFLLTPLISARAKTQEDIQRVRELVKQYGDNCSSYLALEKDKQYLFGRTVEGVIAYGMVRDTLVVLGEPICASENLLPFLSEIKAYCEKNAYSLLFLSVTSPMLDQYRKMGMGTVKCGEEPRFYLPRYSIAGKEGSKIRLNINHATREGLRVLEYRPNEHRDLAVESEIIRISQEWFSMKKSGELVFTMGTIGFDNPMDRRYFYAVDPQGEIAGFIVFLPFMHMTGYVADVTRYRKTSPRGTVEKLFYEACMTFRSEGIEWASLAPAPLARLGKETDAAAKLLNTIYEKMNDIYGFKALYQAKLKYNPTSWEPSYYVYDPPRLTPSVAYSIIRIQNPLGIEDYAKAFLRGRRAKRTARQYSAARPVLGQGPAPAASGSFPAGGDGGAQLCKEEKTRQQSDDMKSGEAEHRHDAHHD